MSKEMQNSNKEEEPNSSKSVGTSVKCGTAIKKRKIDVGVQELELNQKLMDSGILQELSNAWETGVDYEDSDGLRVSSTPFTHAEIENFIIKPGFMESLHQIASSEVEFEEKASDLLQFSQSDDLTETTVQEIGSIRVTLQTKVLELLLKITKFPLNGQVDMFLSNYQRTDFLLCHDDELESRRIAFILYLTPEWKQEFGGCLDLFNSSDDIRPLSVNKSIIPSFNKFVFFDVNCKSFHQVAEVTEPEVERIALSGWFYGEPVPRPEFAFPEAETYTLTPSPMKDVLKNYVTNEYTEEEFLTLINEELVKESHVMLVDFIKPEQSSQISEQLSQLKWETSGPANIHRFHSTNLKLFPDETEFISPLTKLAGFFHSDEFLGLLEKATEFQFSKADSVASGLRKFDHTSYCLLKPHLENPDRADGNASDDDAPEVSIIDLIYYSGGFDGWKDEWGGLTIYNDEEGEQLITITPRSNSLAIVIRNASVSSYVNYVNCLALDSTYFTYTMTFTFKGES